MWEVGILMIFSYSTAIFGLGILTYMIYKEMNKKD